MTAFRDALKAHIDPGVTTVADIGTGTGVIGVMAAKLGAKRVYMYESAEVAGVADAVIRKNKTRACTLFPCRSTEFQDPPKVDLVVSETLGNYAFEEDIIATLRDAQLRHLAPGGRISPREIKQFLAPVTANKIDNELRVWRSVGSAVGLELDLAAAEALSVNNIYVREIPERDMFESAGVEWDRVALGQCKSAKRQGEAVWTLTRALSVYGFALWWTADLGGGVILSTAPGAEPTHWQQLYMPLAEPIEFSPKERLRVSVRSTTSADAGTNIAWAASKESPSGEVVLKQSMDLNKGFLP